MFNTRTLTTTYFALCGLMIAVSPALCSDLVLHPSADTQIMDIPDGAKYNYGSDPFMLAYNVAGERITPLLQFDLSESKARPIRSARLRLWCLGWQGDFSNTSATTIYALSTPWEETEASWYQASNKALWTTPGGDFVQNNTKNSVFAINRQGLTMASGISSMMEWDVTDLVRLWSSKRLKNCGLSVNAESGMFMFESRESPFTEMHPQLILSFGK